MRIRKPNYDDISITHNTRVAYPVRAYPQRVDQGHGHHPERRAVFDLRCLWRAAAHLASDGRCRHVPLCDGLHGQDFLAPRSGVTEPNAHVPPRCSESRFMPLDPMVYRQDARRAYRRRAHPRLSGQHRLDWRRYMAWAIVSSWPTRARWSRAPSTAPSRIASSCTTTSLTSTFPLRAHGVPDGILVPRQYWQSTARYDEAAHNLAVMFEENFEKKYSHLPESVKAAGPHAQVPRRGPSSCRGLLGLRH